MAFSSEQDNALLHISAWLKDPCGPQLFRLFGYAGTGKTTLARHIAAHVRGEVLFCAYTGKAAMVLREKGCEGAQTIHSLIYVPSAEPRTGGIPGFVRNPASRAKRAALIVLDECSMVGEQIGRDLLSCGARVLVLGDPFQLAPVEGGGFFTAAEPDFRLEEVHRQAADSPVIRLSMEVRNGRALRPGDYGDSRVLTRGALERRAVVEADQFLIGTNKGRRDANARIRRARGLPAAGPVVGDKLVCLRNDQSRGLVNGGQYTVESLHRSSRAVFDMRVVPEGGASADGIRVVAAADAFSDPLSGSQRASSDNFDYGYAMTVHKAQGSQWGSVVLVCDLLAQGEAGRRWLYTGLTRASARVVVAL